MVHDTDECEARGGVVEVSRQYARGVVSEHVVRQRDLGQRRVIGERVGQQRQPRVVDATAVQLEPAQQRTRRHELGQPRTVLRSRYTTRTYTSVSQQCCACSCITSTLDKHHSTCQTVYPQFPHSVADTS